MIKSPLNYIGGKYRLFPQLLPLFPEKINTFVDLFAGGLDVSLNVHANRIVCNDINYYVIGLFEYFKHNTIDTIIDDTQRIIHKYNLTKQNGDGYYALREQYNKNHSPLLLFLLICYGFNHQLRYNNNGEFNNPFGKNRSSFNANTEKNLRQMHEKLQDIELKTGNFRDFNTEFMGAGDFLYADPPYLISCGSYNDGKRGFEGWKEHDDLALYEKLDGLNDRNIRFAMSNIIRHKGDDNNSLIEWAKGYHTHFLYASYANSNYQARASETVEVLITNY